jgi:hypothetical protein
MTLFYSATTLGFYDDEIHAPEIIPNDKIEITSEYHQKLLNGQSEGLTIVPDENGYPISKLIVPPLPTSEENANLARIYLENTNWAIMPDVADPTKANPYLGNQDEYISYRNSIRQYIINPVEGNVNWFVLPVPQWIKI